MAEEKIYTVPLRRGFLKAANYDRTRKAIVVLKEFLKKHTKKGRPLDPPSEMLSHFGKYA